MVSDLPCWIAVQDDSLHLRGQPGLRERPRRVLQDDLRRVLQQLQAGLCDLASGHHRQDLFRQRQIADDVGQDDMGQDASRAAALCQLDRGLPGEPGISGTVHCDEDLVEHGGILLLGNRAKLTL